MTQHNHQSAPTQFVETNGIRFAYRRFGKTGGSPIQGKLRGGASGRPPLNRARKFAPRPDGII